MEVDIEIKSDATAAIGMCRRLGLGKVRHLATADLWVQQRVRIGDLRLLKLPGVDNPSDQLTKHRDNHAILRFLSTVGVVPLTGRAASAPQRVPLQALATGSARDVPARRVSSLPVVEAGGGVW